MVGTQHRGRNDDGPRAARRVVLLGGAMLVAVLVTIGVAYSDTEAVTGRTATMNRSLADLELLTDARDQLNQAQTTFGAALEQTDALTMTSQVADALDQYSDGLASWTAYKERADLAGIEAQVTSIDEALANVRTLGEEIAAQALQNPSQADQWSALFQEQVGGYNAIRAQFDELESVARGKIGVQAEGLADQASRDQKLVLAVGALIVVVLAAGTALIARSAHRREASQRAAEVERSVVARRNALDANLQAALDMADTEDHALSVVGRALHEVMPERSSEVLLTGVGGAMARSVAVGPPSSGCQVPSTERCPAARNGQRLVFPTPSSLDACWYLQERPDGPCSAVCAPLSVAGNAVGIIHVVAPELQPPADHELATIDLIARKTSESLSTIRAFGHASTQARTDPLTGLLNRRSLEQAAATLDDEGTPYVVAFADLDRFKVLNDTHGHAAGDAALRLFARVLRSSVRPDDITSRWGGEEFLLVLPNCTLDGAVEIMERVRANLAVALAGTDVPPFTVSFGAATSSVTSAFSSVVAQADEYLLQAKAAGRNRIITASNA